MVAGLYPYDDGISLAKGVNVAPRWTKLLELRAAYGFLVIDSMPMRSARAWSESKIAEMRSSLLAVPILGTDDWIPRNASLLVLLQKKFSWLRFRWKIKECDLRKTVILVNTPKIEGKSLTLFDMHIVPVEWVDGYPALTEGDVLAETGDSNERVFASHGLWLSAGY